MSKVGPLTRSEWASVLIFVAILVIGILYMTFGSFKQDFLVVTTFIQDHQTSGFFIFVLILTIASCLPGPVFVVVIAAGFCFKSPVIAFFAAYVGSLCGCSLNFVISRRLLREIVEKHIIQEYKFLTAMDGLVQRKGLMLVSVIRIPFTPFSKVSYLLSCTGVTYFDFIVGTAIGIIPAVILMVAIGAGLQSLDENTNIPTWIVIVGAVFVISVFGGVSWYTHMLLQEEMERQAKEEGGQTADGGADNDTQTEKEALLNNDGTTPPVAV